MQEVQHQMTYKNNLISNIKDKILSVFKIVKSYLEDFEIGLHELITHIAERLVDVFDSEPLKITYNKSNKVKYINTNSKKKLNTKGYCNVKRQVCRSKC